MLLSWLAVDGQLDDGLNDLLTGVLNDANNISHCLSASYCLPQFMMLNIVCCVYYLYFTEPPRQDKIEQSFKF